MARVATIGEALKAGTNCGSRRGEISLPADPLRQFGDARHHGICGIGSASMTVKWLPGNSA